MQNIHADLTKAEIGLLAAAMAQAPFAALLFRADDNFTLIWRNTEHEAISGSVGIDVVGRGMFDAFPPNDSGEGAAAKDAIQSAVKQMYDTLQSKAIGPYRYDLKKTDGSFEERHWRIQMSPIIMNGTFSAVLQIVHDATDEVLKARLEDSLRRSASKTAGVSFFAYDPETDFFERTTAVDEMFGFFPGEAGAHAAPFFARIHPEDLPGVLNEVQRVLVAPRGAIAAFDYRVPQNGGTERFIRIRAEIIIDPSDRREKLMGTFIDLTDVENQRRRLQRDVDLRQALAQEANHRIKNSLAIALSMLRLEKRAIMLEGENSWSNAVAALTALEARIGAISGAHGLMQLNADHTDVSLHGLLGALISQARSSAGLRDGALELDLSGGDVQLTGESAISLGIILSELLTNAIKYGLDRTGFAEINVKVTAAPTGHEIIVRNKIENNSIDAIASTKMGTEIIRQLAQAIGADIIVQNDGSVYAVHLRLDRR